MSASAQTTINLADYTPPAFLVDTVDLTFTLSPDATRVTSKIAFRPNPDCDDRAFFLHGQDLRLVSAKINGADVTPVLCDDGLRCDVPDGPFTWEAEVEIAPATNTALEGLYMSGGMYCTQCEAEGFRKITYYPDRPDVMAVFSVTIHSDMPVLLSNGNQVAHGKWHDPWPKPAYLFALVAGDLVAHSDQFTTMDGKQVALNIFVRDGDLHKCAFAMQALKSSMTWDEDTYGRAYDLDVFNIVAVDDFNMGAMENKGLNIFNSSCVLASADTATDSDFERIEAIIAHEYFHNWTGNRVTCRDWFQLCLKEGLTVFRDQQFTGDMRGHAVKRIEDATVLRAHQFREDAGPLAHPVRPASYVEINNFYTVTVYEKGAELIAMLKLMVGDAAYYDACALYFDRHDGQAATIEDWIAAFADTTGRDLSQFARWYAQAGTPHVRITQTRDGDDLLLDVTQSTQPTPDNSAKDPFVIPLSLGIIGNDGQELLATQTHILTKAHETLRFENIPQDAVVSAFRNFSAPVKVQMDQSDADRAHLLAYDTDTFNRWNAGRDLAGDLLRDMVLADRTPDPAFLDGLARVLRDDTLDPSFRASVLSMPSQNDTANAIVAANATPDPYAIYLAHMSLRQQIAQHIQDIMPRIYADMAVTGPYNPNARDSGKRFLSNVVLGYLRRIDGGKQAAIQFETADNMTLQAAALGALLSAGKGTDQASAFYDQWHDDRLVLDKWFAMQVGCAAPENAVAVARTLTQHAKFDWKNPNRFRSVFGALAGNTAGFHARDGSGYDLMADWLIKLDGANPQTAAAMTKRFDSWAQFAPARQAQMRAALTKIANTPALSRDTTEIVTRILG